MGDAALVAALRCQDQGALREFYLRFRPMLVGAAARLGLAPGDRETAADDCLADVAVHLITTSGAPPRSLPAYLARSLRNRILNGARARARAEGREPEAVGPTEADLAGSSEHARRASGALDLRSKRICRVRVSADYRRAFRSPPTAVDAEDWITSESGVEASKGQIAFATPAFHEGTKDTKCGLCVFRVGFCWSGAIRVPS